MKLGETFPGLAPRWCWRFYWSETITHTYSVSQIAWSLWKISWLACRFSLCQERRTGDSHVSTNTWTVLSFFCESLLSATANRNQVRFSSIWFCFPVKPEGARKAFARKLKLNFWQRRRNAGQSDAVCYYVFAFFISQCLGIIECVCPAFREEEKWIIWDP